MRNLIFILLALSASAATACTTVVVGRKCSATGRVIVGHNEDSFGSTVRAFRVPPRTHGAGATLPAEPGRAAIPQVASTRGFYWLEVRERATGLGVSPCDAAFNDAGVLVVSNNALCRECAETNRLTAGGVYYNLRRAVAERARTAREAVSVITNLVSSWGYASAGRIYTVADASEAWQVHVLYGKRFIARRCPDDGVVLTANCCSMRTREPGDVLADEFRALPERFSYADAFELRGDWTKGHYVYRWRNLARSFTGRAWPDDAAHLPYAVRPSAPVTAEAVRLALASHYEGTEDEIPVGADGTRHDERVRAPLCRGETLFSSVWSFGARPDDMDLSLAVGPPCGHPATRVRPLVDALPGGEEAVRALERHCLK